MKLRTKQEIKYDKQITTKKSKNTTFNYDNETIKQKRIKNESTL